MTWWRWPLALVLIVSAVLAVGYCGPASPPVRSPLGVRGGDDVGEYVARAQASVSGNGTRWALVSLRARVVPERLPDIARGVRVSRVIYHPVIAGAQAPLRMQSVPGGDAALLISASYAASQLLRDSALSRLDAGAGQIARLSAAQLNSGCACAVALVVWGELSALRPLAGHAAVRAVEVLPPGVGVLSVNPLLPEHITIAGLG